MADIQEIQDVVEERLIEICRKLFHEHPFIKQSEEERNKLKIAAVQKLEVAFPRADHRKVAADLSIDFSENHIDFVFSEEGYEELVRAIFREEMSNG
jgi:hypothetical protein